MGVNLSLKIFLLAIAISLIASYFYDPAKDKEEISKITDDYLSKLSRQLRTSGITSIEILSRDIKFKGYSATEKLSAVFKIYNPFTNQSSGYNDNITFIFERTFIGWELKDVKYEKTKW